MMRILHVIPAFLPATAWGGPVFSTSALARAAARAGHEVTVLTTDCAHPEHRTRLKLTENPAQFPEGYRVHYAPLSFGQSGSWTLLKRLPGLIRRADLVHLSMTYSFPTLPTLALCRFYGKPVVWSPRGAIQATAEWPEASHPRIKRLFERLAHALAPRGTVLHTTAPAETQATARRMPGLEGVTISNSVTVPASLPPRSFRPEGQLRLLFLSRLHHKKGLGMLIEALARLPRHVELAVAGTGHPSYEAALRAQVSALGLSDRVRFLGHVDARAKEEAFAAADAVVLPTFSENFGIAVAEGLAHGLPAVTTTGAPWAELEDRGCGAWVAPTPEALEAALRRLDTYAPETLAEMGARGHAWMLERFAEEPLGRDMVALYASLAGQAQVSA
jgi:glycosyltransferase involved in cell wall biosynthesis